MTVLELIKELEVVAPTLEVRASECIDGLEWSNETIESAVLMDGYVLLRWDK